VIFIDYVRWPIGNVDYVRWPIGNVDYVRWPIGNVLRLFLVPWSMWFLRSQKFVWFLSHTSDWIIIYTDNLNVVPRIFGKRKFYLSHKHFLFRLLLNLWRHFNRLCFCVTNPCSYSLSGHTSRQRSVPRQLQLSQIFCSHSRTLRQFPERKEIFQLRYHVNPNRRKRKKIIQIFSVYYLKGKCHEIVSEMSPRSSSLGLN
jgi:hypothetical protein